MNSVFGKKHERALKRALMRMYRSKDFARHKKDILAVHNTPRMFQALAIDVDALAKKSAVYDMANALDPSSERPLLKWLWEHREEILEFILRIVALFSGS
ncbi:MAG: hypothetical protein QXG97_00100 [Nitrososphaerota archaeon]